MNRINHRKPVELKQCGRNAIKRFPDPKDQSSSGAKQVFKDGHVNCFCASLVHNQIHTKNGHAWKRAPSNEVNVDRADGHYYNFAWIQRSWTFGDPYFSFDRSFYLPISYVLRKKWRKSLDYKFDLSQNAPSNSVLFSYMYPFICLTVFKCLLKS